MVEERQNSMSGRQSTRFPVALFPLPGVVCICFFYLSTVLFVLPRGASETQEPSSGRSLVSQDAYVNFRCLNTPENFLPECVEFVPCHLFSRSRALMDMVDERANARNKRMNKLVSSQSYKSDSYRATGLHPRNRPNLACI